jgi:hypothetical protein
VLRPLAAIVLGHFSGHEGISAFSVWTQCGLLSPQSLANFAEIRFSSAIVVNFKDSTRRRSRGRCRGGVCMPHHICNKSLLLTVKSQEQYTEYKQPSIFLLTMQTHFVYSHGPNSLHCKQFHFNKFKIFKQWQLNFSYGNTQHNIWQNNLISIPDICENKTNNYKQ